MENEKTLSFGQKAVGITFNPSGNESVNKAKQLSADLIDLVEENLNSKSNQGQALISWSTAVLRTAAFTAIITAQMAVVKFITYND